MKLRTTKISIDEKVRNDICEVLNLQLANLSDLYSQTKQAHWNVKGPLFFQLHKLFDELAESVEEHIDELAERITTLGFVANGTVRDAAKNSSLKEFPSELKNESEFVSTLVDRFAASSNSCRKAIETMDECEDKISEDLLIKICTDIDKGLWMLESCH